MIFGKKEKQGESDIEHFIPLFGHNLLRDEVLPDLLGKEHNIILYWAGKSLARKYPLSSKEEIIDFFLKAGWGELVLEKESRSELIFDLTSPSFSNRKTAATPLESGFIAEQIQTIKGYPTETNETYKKGKINKMIYHVKWDQHDV